MCIHILLGQVLYEVVVEDTRYNGSLLLHELPINAKIDSHLEPSLRVFRYISLTVQLIVC